MFTVDVRYRKDRFEYQYEQIVVLLGRAKDNDIVLTDRFASFHHCMLIHMEGRFFLKDRNSRNGTRLDGRWVRGQHSVTPGQDILIGETLIRIRLEYDSGSRTKLTRIVPQSSDPDATPTIGTKLDSIGLASTDFYGDQTPIPGSLPMLSTVPPPPARTTKTPTRASLRLMIDQVVLHASQLRALLIDHFPKLAQQASSEMDRLSVVSLLLERESAVEILRCLQFAFPEACAEHWALLRWE